MATTMVLIVASFINVSSSAALYRNPNFFAVCCEWEPLAAHTPTKLTSPTCFIAGTSVPVANAPAPSSPIATDALAVARAVRLLGLCYDASCLCGRWWKGNQDSEKFFTGCSSNQFIGRVRFVDRKSVCDQRADVYFAIGEKPEKSFHVARFRPAHIADGIIDALLFVGGVIAAWAVGARNAEVEFLLVKSPALERHANRANGSDNGAIASHFGG